MGVLLKGRVGSSRKDGAERERRYRQMEHTFLFNVLPLPRFRSFSDGLAEERHELAIAGSPCSCQRRR